MMLQFRDFSKVCFRTAACRCEEHANDINKLIEFFEDCQAQNTQFRWDVKLDQQGSIAQFILQSMSILVM
ncbi:hypothetical protein C2845_PM05G17760 [Panicum miliaceum]|uniref:Uncharacterized protein n=1 Tax=Panicum miliaceum TaxID=4540 RepID=A0A3L6SXT2_PANMI|nr:hypothetical protein C2845_PM05G17760 [Panicum miliaceum]